jgi:hypothetical protein
MAKGSKVEDYNEALEELQKRVKVMELEIKKIDKILHVPPVCHKR